MILTIYTIFHTVLLVYVVIDASYVCSTHTIAFHCTVANAINVIAIFICIGAFIAILMVPSVSLGNANVYSWNITDSLVPLMLQTLLIFHHRSKTISVVYTYRLHIFFSKLVSTGSQCKITSLFIDCPYLLTFTVTAPCLIYMVLLSQFQV